MAMRARVRHRSPIHVFFFCVRQGAKEKQIDKRELFVIDRPLGSENLYNVYTSSYLV